MLFPDLATSTVWRDSYRTWCDLRALLADVTAAAEQATGADLENLLELAAMLHAWMLDLSPADRFLIHDGRIVADRWAAAAEIENRN